MSFVRTLSTLVKDKHIGKRVVPIVPDEARTFGMEGMFRQLGIYSSVGQRYTPHDAGQIMFYKEDIKGQIMEEGINEAGAIFRLAGPRHVLLHQWLPDDPVLHLLFHVRLPAHRRPGLGGGGLPGARLSHRRTAGRTTLNGEGLQHQDGHSLVLASTDSQLRERTTRPMPTS